MGTVTPEERYYLSPRLYLSHILTQRYKIVKEISYKFMSEEKNINENIIITNNKPETNLKRSDFFYELPEELIAQVPSEKRDMSRLMVLDRKTGETSHHVFHDVVDMLECGDVLVINNSKVIPARIYGTKDDSGIKAEILLLRCIENDRWEVLVRPGRRLKKDAQITFGDGILHASVIDITPDGNRIVDFRYNKEKYTLSNILEIIGEMPLPPYITSRQSSPERYQTVYADKEGSAAAPTAGLHFTPELLDAIKAKGIKVVPVMLHVGLGTFRPVKEDDISDHIMHSEYFEVSRESADIINSRKGRIVAVGTTSCRVLESASDENGIIHPMCANTEIFIYPGYRFKATDALITNFHLPESTLLMLVSAFSDRETMLSAYKTAIENRYRFFSFGDAMLIL